MDGSRAGTEADFAMGARIGSCCWDVFEEPLLREPRTMDESVAFLRGEHITFIFAPQLRWN